MREVTTLARGCMAAVLVVTCAVLTSCAKSGDATPFPSPAPSLPPSSTPPSLASTMPHATATTRKTPSSEDRARSEATELVQKYFVVDSSIRSNSRIPLNRYYEVASDKFVAGLLQFAQQERRRGHRQIGIPNTSAPIATVVTLKGIAKVNVKVCVDVRGVDVVDRAGKSVIDAKRTDTYWVEMIVINRKYPSPKNWRISDAKSKEKACDA